MTTYTEDAIGQRLRWLSLGVPLGSRFVDSDSAPAVIRLGGRMVSLEPALYDTWMALRLLADGRRVKHRSLARTQLEERGLVMRIAADPPTAVEQIDPLIPIASGLGVGNSAAFPDAFVIVAQNYRPLAVVDAAAYGVWARADGRHTVRSACRETRDELGSQADLRAGFLQSLPVLLGCGLIFLDPAIRSEDG